MVPLHFVFFAVTEEDLLCRITAHNRSSDRAAPIHILPHLVYRNRWAWGYSSSDERPWIRMHDDGGLMLGGDKHLGERHYYMTAVGGRGTELHDTPLPFIFTDNDTNYKKLYGAENRTKYVKDAFHEYLVGGRQDAVNPEGVGTKAAGHVHATVPPGSSVTVYVRFCKRYDDGEPRELCGQRSG